MKHVTKIGVGLIVAAYVVVLGGCPDPGPPGCESDADCKGDRVCELGDCVDADDGSSDDGNTDDGSDDDGTPSTGKGCGEFVIQCGCNGNTTLQPGQITNNQVCESGQGIADICGGPVCFGGTYPWQVTCFCQ